MPFQQLFFNVLDNKMDKKLKSTLTRKIIPRLKIVNCREQSLSEHRHPSINYFDKIVGHRSYLTLATGEQKQFNNPKNRQEINGNRPYASKISNLSLQCLNNSKNTLTSLVPKENNVQGKAQPTQSSFILGSMDQPNQPQPQQFPTICPQQQYLTYEEYQKLIAAGKVQPGHFQALARRNDHQRVRSSAEQCIISSSMYKKNKERVGKSSRQQTIRAVRANTKKNLTEVSQAKIEPPTIINTKVGALSNIAIRQALEHQQMHFLSQSNKSVGFTEESDQRSEKDTKKMTIKDELVPSQRKAFSKKSPKILQINKNQLKKATLGKYSQLFQRIYSTEDFVSQQQPVKLSSLADDFSTQQQKLMRFDDIYRVKKAVLKHKLDWKF